MFLKFILLLLTLQGSVAKKPYNPIIGETFHCSWKVPKKSKNTSTNNSNVDSAENDVSPQQQSGGTDGETKLFYCAEQVSHHPPSKSLQNCLFGFFSVTKNLLKLGKYVSIFICASYFFVILKVSNNKQY